MISAFFANKGLVRQQLDSFNEFVNTSMQEIIEEGGRLEVEPQVNDGSQQALESCYEAACNRQLQRESAGPTSVCFKQCLCYVGYKHAPLRLRQLVARSLRHTLPHSKNALL